MTQPLEKTVAGLRRRLWVERGLFTGVLLGVLAAWLCPALAPSAWVVSVDGKPVVSLRERSEAEAALAQIKQQAGAPATAAFAQNVRLVQGRPSPLTAPDARGAVAKLKPLLKVRADRAVIYVDGQAVVALPDERVAQQVLQQIKARYTGGLEKLAAEPHFKEKVEVRTETVDQELWADADTAHALLTGEGDEGTHTVQSGDSPWSISRQYHLAEADFRRMNPSVNFKRLKIGQAVRVGANAAPLVTVVTEGKLTRTEPASYETIVKRSPQMYVGKRVLKHEGKPGKQRVTLSVRCENGTPVDKQVLARTVLAPSKPKVVVLGGKPRP